MDKKWETLFQSVENEQIKFIKVEPLDYSFHEGWTSFYQIKGNTYEFTVVFSDYEQQFSIGYSANKLKENKQERQDFSYIFQQLVEKIKNAPFLKIKFALRQLHLHTSNIEEIKYYIRDVEQFEKRKNPQYVEQNKKEIDDIFHSSLISSKQKEKENDIFWILKEDDDIVLADYLLTTGYMQKVTNVNEEDYLKLHPSFSCNATLFFEIFSEKMKMLGYNIYYESFSSLEKHDDEDYYEYYYDDYSSIFDPFYGFEEEDYEEYFHIKKKK